MPVVTADDLLLPGWIQASIKNGNDIPKAFWREAVQRLNPSRVFTDRTNIAVVTDEDEHAIRGIYFQPVVSSYWPRDEDGRAFSWNACTGHREFVFDKPGAEQNDD